MNNKLTGIIKKHLNPHYDAYIKEKEKPNFFSSFQVESELSIRKTDSVYSSIISSEKNDCENGLSCEKLWDVLDIWVKILVQIQPMDILRFSTVSKKCYKIFLHLFGLKSKCLFLTHFNLNDLILAPNETKIKFAEGCTGFALKMGEEELTELGQLFSNKDQNAKPLAMLLRVQKLDMQAIAIKPDNIEIIHTLLNFIAIKDNALKSLVFGDLYALTKEIRVPRPLTIPKLKNLITLTFLDLYTCSDLLIGPQEQLEKITFKDIHGAVSLSPELKALKELQFRDLVFCGQIINLPKNVSLNYRRWSSELTPLLK